MEKTMNLQIKIITNKPDTQTMTQIEKALTQQFKTNPNLKGFTLVDVVKGK